MKIKTLLAVVAFAVIIVGAIAITAYAASNNPNSGNEVTAKPIEKAQLKVERAQERIQAAQEKLDEIKEKLRIRAAQTENQSENETENETENNVTALKIAPGRLISQVQQARREVWDEAKDILKEAGYQGRVNEFQLLFNQFTKSMKNEIREKLTSGNDTNLSATVVREIAKRELTRIREEILARMNITSEDIADEVENETGNNTTATFILAQLRGSSPEFRGKLFLALKDATPEEKAQIIAQINEFAQSTGAQLRIREADAERIRDRLRERVHVQEILAE